MDSFPLERPYITITNVIWSFDYDMQQVKVLLIKRADEPFKIFGRYQKYCCEKTKVHTKHPYG